MQFQLTFPSFMKVFMINPTGEIRIPVKSTTYKKSYEMLSDLVSEMFPPVSSLAAHEDFGANQFWEVRPIACEDDWG
jgi:phosphatidate phosphatase PAH1